MPLLHASPHSRVLSVLNRGKEKFVIEDDLALEHNWFLLNPIKHITCMVSSAFDYLAAHNETVTFVHNFLGLVMSDNHRKTNPSPPKCVSPPRRVFYRAVKYFAALICYFVGMISSETGERQACHLTSSISSPVA